MAWGQAGLRAFDSGAVEKDVEVQSARSEHAVKRGPASYGPQDLIVDGRILGLTFDRCALELKREWKRILCLKIWHQRGRSA